MKSKILRVATVILLLITLTQTNMILVGSSLISYAGEDTTTNHPNVEFEAYFKDDMGKKETTISKTIKDEEIYLYLKLNVKKEGYLNGKITVSNSNFTLKESDNPNIQKIENNTIYLNQINVGMTEEIKIKIEPIQKENFDIGLLDATSKIDFEGTYKNRTEKDNKIEATRELKLVLIENNTPENLINQMEIITNKIVKIEGQDKRIIQISYNMGLKDNDYPMKEINTELQILTIDENKAEVYCKVYGNNMTHFDWKYEEEKLQLTFKNEPKEQEIKWNKQGNENVIITCIYEPQVNIENLAINTQEKLVLYNNKELSSDNNITVGTEEKDAIIQIDSKNSEESIYKGKLYAGIDREYQSVTSVKVNALNLMENITIQEEPETYQIGEYKLTANVNYMQTAIAKNQFDSILGEDGKIEIYDQNQSKIATIDNTNLSVTYPEGTTSIKIITTKPIAQGNLQFKHTKVIKPSGDIVKSAEQLNSNIIANYNNGSDKNTYTEGPFMQAQTAISLQNTTTKASIEIDKPNLSTVVANKVEIKAILLSNDEKYDLYKNPHLSIELPEEVENIQVNNIKLLYENELQVTKCQLDGRTIYIDFEGQQTEYKEEVVKGATIVIDANLELNKRAMSEDRQIIMNYSNEGAIQYADGDIGRTTSDVKVVAPRDITAIQSIKELGVETLGEEEKEEVFVERGDRAKTLENEIELINNYEETIENVKILGNFPTNNDQNNMGIQVVNPINLEEIPNARIYYTQNSNATEDLENQENAWSEEIQDNSEVSKYLIVIDQVEPKTSLKGTYSFNVPENLEYNQQASASYQVKYESSSTQAQSEITATDILMETGVGPEVETKVTALVEGKESNEPVKNGEVIHYKIQVSNTGTTDVSQVQVTGQVPNGTVMVEPVEHYEYTGEAFWKELNNETYESTVENLKVGEVIYKEYDVRVKTDTQSGTSLKNEAQIQYGDVVKKSEVTNTTAKGDIRVTVKRITDRQIDLKTYGSYRCFAIIENLSQERKENIIVKANLSENIKVDSLQLITGIGVIDENTDDDDVSDREIDNEEITYQEEVNIGTLEPGQTKVLNYISTLNNSKDNMQTIQFSVEVKQGEEVYRSNLWKDEFSNINVAISMTDNTQSEYVKSNDTIEYTIKLENKSDCALDSICVRDVIPEQLNITKITVNDNEQEILEGNNVYLPVEVEKDGTVTVKIQTAVSYDETRKTAEVITNTASAEMVGDTMATTSTITHIIQPEEEQQQQDADDEKEKQPDGDDDDGDDSGSNEGNENNPNEDNNDNENNNNGNNDVATGDKMITGVAWFDENSNGQKDDNEELLSGIKVQLLNTGTNQLVKEENGSILEETTNDSGVYVLEKIESGSYIVIFNYDNSIYDLTTYQAQGVPEKQNSKVMKNEILIGSERKQVSATDIIQVADENISNINIGLIKMKNFDLKLDKFVNRILIQNASGTTVREYNNANMAKIELNRKQVNGTTVIIEYKIVVTNQGEMDGYVKKIADYAPADLTFSSEMNKDWYKEGNVIYNASLANQKIQPGESKAVTLTLTKKMTDSNTGLVANTAEIAESYNEAGVTDSNSVPGNRKQGENDYSLAEVILSIGTGGIIYIGIAIIVIMILAVITLIIIRNKKKKSF